MARSKSSPAIFSVTPLLPSASGRVVESGTTITINGTGFGSTRCLTCQVLVYPGPVTLTPSSWSDTAIKAVLPSTFNGIAQIVVLTLTPQEDFINIMAAPAPASLTSCKNWRHCRQVSSSTFSQKPGCDSGTAARSSVAPERKNQNGTSTR